MIECFFPTFVVRRIFMYKKLIYLMCLIFMLNLVARVDAAGIHIDIDGMVVIEGENFTGADRRSDPMGYQWRISTAFGGFAGTGYVDTPYGTGTDGTWVNGCELTYTFRVSANATYTIWVRRNAAVSGWNDSCFVGLDGVQVGNLDNTANYQQWIWVDRGTMDVTAGIHTFHLRRLETGYYVDRILFTTNADYEPTGQGPAETLVFERAFNPDPADGAEEVSRDASLSWSPGDFANAHDV